LRERTAPPPTKLYVVRGDRDQTIVPGPEETQ
jgi:hypothetical protein